jgi:hypothetical protein
MLFNENLFFFGQGYDLLGCDTHHISEDYNHDIHHQKDLRSCTSGFCVFVRLPIVISGIITGDIL